MALLQLGIAAADAALDTETGKKAVANATRSGRTTLQSLQKWVGEKRAELDSGNGTGVVTRRTAEAQAIATKAAVTYDALHANDGLNPAVRARAKNDQANIIADAIVSTRRDKTLNVGGQPVWGSARSIAPGYLLDYKLFRKVQQFIAAGNTVSRDAAWYRDQQRYAFLFSSPEFMTAYSEWLAEMGGTK